MVLFDCYEVGGNLQPSTFFNLNTALISSGGTRVTLFLINILLALAWIALTGHFTATNLIIGLALGYLTLWITQRKQSSAVYLVKLRRVIGFVVYFALEVIKANLRVAYEVITPRHGMRPAVGIGFMAAYAVYTEEKVLLDDAAS